MPGYVLVPTSRLRGGISSVPAVVTIIILRSNGLSGVFLENDLPIAEKSEKDNKEES